MNPFKISPKFIIIIIFVKLSSILGFNSYGADGGGFGSFRYITCVLLREESSNFDEEISKLYTKLMGANLSLTMEFKNIIINNVLQF